MRSTISDFAVFLTIVIMVLIDYLVGVPSPKLHVPEKFEVRNKAFLGKCLLNACSFTDNRTLVLNKNRNLTF